MSRFTHIMLLITVIFLQCIVVPVSMAAELGMNASMNVVMHSMQGADQHVHSKSSGSGMHTMTHSPLAQMPCCPSEHSAPARDDVPANTGVTTCDQASYLAEHGLDSHKNACGGQGGEGACCQGQHCSLGKPPSSVCLNAVPSLFFLRDFSAPSSLVLLPTVQRSETPFRPPIA